MWSSLFVLALGAADTSGSDAAVYTQSLITPKVFVLCKSVDAGQAADYDVALAQWREKNRHAIARGELAVREKAIDGGDDFDAKVDAEADDVTKQIGALPPPQQKLRCQELLERTRGLE